MQRSAFRERRRRHAPSDISPQNSSTTVYSLILHSEALLERRRAGTQTPKQVRRRCRFPVFSLARSRQREDLVDEIKREQKIVLVKYTSEDEEDTK